MPRPVNYAQLPTEWNNPASSRIDQISIAAALRTINKEDRKVPLAVGRALPALEKGVKVIVLALRSGGRMFLLGAGTSGRLAVMEAAEFPPTFNTPPSLVQAFMAGGRSSVFRSKEGAEDRGQDAVRVIRNKVKAGDVVIGIAASGVTAFVREGLIAARRRRARTILITCHSHPPRRAADVVIALRTGPEVIAGSTRLKAASATKMALNALTVVSMVELGKVYRNWMVDLQPRSRKLKARAMRLISVLGEVSAQRAVELLSASGRNAKTAIVMARRHVNRNEAARLLKKAGGRLHKALSLRGA